jgi:hypothetical protein
LNRIAYYPITFRELYDKLLDRINNISSLPATSSVAGIPELSFTDNLLTLPIREDYPNVTYWTQEEWRQARAKKKEKRGLASTLITNLKATSRQGYVTSAAGLDLTASQAADMRTTARCLWASLAKAGKAPPTWGQADHHAIQYFRGHMYQLHPELRLCAGNWKADLLAIQEYPSWYRNHSDGSYTIKSEPVDVSGVSSMSGIPSLHAKRTRKAGSDSPRKRCKIKHETQPNVTMSVISTAVIPLSAITYHTESHNHSLPRPGSSPEPEPILYSNIMKTATTGNILKSASRNHL